jgi:signal transduction histidine kinase
MATDPVRKEAMDRARDTGEPAMTGRVTLVQEIVGPKQAGFLIYLPVYRGVTPSTVEGRRKALAGFVYAPFRAGDLFRHLFGSEEKPRVAVQVYDGEPGVERLLYDGATGHVAPDARSGLERISLAGREWTLRVVALPTFTVASPPAFTLGLVLGGLLVSFALYVLALGQARAREKADEDRSVTHTLMRLGMTFASELEPQKLIQRLVDEATSLVGAQMGGYFQNVLDAEGRFSLFTLSGISAEAFARMPSLRATPLFAPTFAGRGPIRYDDVTRSPNFGNNPPYHGLPKGHVPVRSYLAMPVRSRTGTVMGALLFGHAEPGRFTAQHERQCEALAAQAAIALDNARLYQEAQEAIRLRDEFLSVASHELKTPLTPLTLKLELMLRKVRRDPADPALPGQVKDTLEVAQRQVQRLGRLVTDLLDVTRITAGRMRIERAQTDLAQLAREVTLRFEAQAARVHVPLAVSGEAQLLGSWDAERLDQVLTILVDNAIKYGAGQPVEVRLGHSELGLAEVSVVDHGIGIAPEAIPHIFDRFVRAVSERNYGGLGLGLYIARKIVESHGGTLRVRSTPGEETVFTLSLPVERVEVPPVPGTELPPERFV